MQSYSLGNKKKLEGDKCLKNIHISGFSDEISSDFEEQLTVVKDLGMKYISIRGVNGKNIGDYTVHEITNYVKPKLDEYGIKVSSIGSPIGKVFINDEEGYEKQLTQLKNIVDFCKLLDCKYIRMFSFYIPKAEDVDSYKEVVVSKLKSLTEIAAAGNVILLHENEKDIFGDTDVRCKTILEEVNSPYFKAIFDFANFVQVNVDTIKAYKLLKDYIEYIHIKDAEKGDNQNVPCGTGDGNIQAILKDAIQNGYEGFLTMEPHLAVFDSLKDLELEDVNEIIKDDRGLDGKGAYTVQYNALIEVLKYIEKEIN